MCFLRLSALKECEETLRTKINRFLFTGLRSAGRGGEGEEEEEEGQEG